MRYVLNIEQQGARLHVKPIEPRPMTHVVDTTRGHITEFSMKSRKRLIEMLASFDAEKIKFARERVKFITVTYQDIMTHGATVKRHLKRFMERIRYHNPESWAIWKLEYQERGSLHLHFIVGNMQYTDKDIIKQMWRECSDQEGFVMTRIEAIKSLNGVLRYASKYMTKTVDVASCIYLSAIPSDEQQDQAPGRFWGVYGRKFLPLATLYRTAVALTSAQYDKFIKLANNQYAAKEHGYTLFQENTKALFDWLQNQLSGDIEQQNYLELFTQYVVDCYVIDTFRLHHRTDIAQRTR